MSRARSMFAAIFIIALPRAAAASDVSHLAGTWTVMWEQDAGNANMMKLEVHADQLTGAYVNDQLAKCPVSGNFSSATGMVSLAVVCPKWTISMRGTLSTDGMSVQGSYQAYADAAGNFRMQRKTVN